MTATETSEERTVLLSQPHHDGSDLYVLERPEELGATAVVRLRTPLDAARALVRYERDGEPRHVEAVVDEETPTERWWRMEFPVWNPVTRYRFLVAGAAGDYTWVNALGRTAHEVADADDFVLAAAPAAPAWHAGAAATTKSSASATSCAVRPSAFTQV